MVGEWDDSHDVECWARSLTGALLSGRWGSALAPFYEKISTES